ncbi:MAG: hypothetical protein HZA13_08620 [Nitrospirae bacterium]|nr:hypothetical protein [Nitrospirota bacterium]
MPFLFRKIDNKRRWDKDASFSWLELHDIQADPVTDLKTSQNILSVYCIDDERSNLDRVVAAIAATRDRFDILDYILFDQRILSEIDVKIEKTIGKTPDEQVNNCHLQLVELSGFKLVNLAKVILNKGETDRVLKKYVAKLIKDGIAAGQIDRSRTGLKEDQLAEI